VTARFRAGGLAVIDADRVAREVVEPGSEGLEAVIEAFGHSVRADDGSLDRKALGAFVFASDSARQQLNRMLHPLIAVRTREHIDRLAEQGVSLACYDAPLLVENGLTDAFRPLVVVAADVATQIARMMTRDGIDEAGARARIAAQAPLDEKVAAADYVINNDGTLAELEARADTVLEAIRSSVQR